LLDERIRYSALRDFVRRHLQKPLPPRTGWMHVVGSLALMAFVGQFVTGVLLLLHYRPTLDDAHQSIRYITGDVPFGWLIRQAHAWGGTLMLLAVVLHMVRTFFSGAFKRPRELTWFLGVFILYATLLTGLTGYLLPWNQRSYWATTVGAEVLATLPLLGESLRQLLLGGTAVGQETLSRFFLLHVILLPWLLVALLVVHLVLVRVHGVATLDEVGKERTYGPGEGVPFWPVHVAREWTAAIACLALLFTLAVLAPLGIGEPANPLETPKGIKPEWYFLPTYQVLKYFPGSAGELLGIVVAAVPFLLLLVWPFVERSPARRPRDRKWAVVVGCFAILLPVALGLLGHFAETTVHIAGRAYDFDTYGVPHVADPQSAGGSSDPFGRAGPG